jgi:glycosyltransferase involved in cell wall biosynthesis
MQIAVACAQFPPSKSGYAQVASNLAREFEATGHQVRVITEGRGCKAFGRVHRLTKEGREILRSGLDVVQIVGPSPLFTEQVVKVASARHVPSIYKIDMFAGLGTYYSGFFARTIDSIYVRTSLARAVLRTDWVVFSTRDFAASFGLPHAPSSIISLGVTDPCTSKGFPPLDLAEPAPDSPLKILFVGQLRRYKGVAYLLEASRLLRDSGRSHQLTIVGGGPSRAELEAQTDRLGLRSNVRFRGPVDDAQLHDEYLSNDVLVVPSLLGESFGIVLLEAAIHGLGVVASDLPGLREVARDLGGTVVPPGNADALARALGNARPLENARRALDRRLVERYSWSKVAQQYLDVYRKILDERRSGVGTAPGR